MGDRSLLTAAEGLAHRPLAKRRHHRLRFVVPAVLLLAIVADHWLGLGYVAALNHVLAPQSAALASPLREVWIVVAAFLAMLTHEMGHVVGALVSGRRVQSIAVLPFVITFEPFRIRPFFRILTGGAGGFVRTATVTRATGWIDIPYYGGGIVANVAAFWVARDWAIAHPGTAESAMAAIFAVISILIALGNLVPFHLPAGRSDGRWLLDIVLGRPESGLRVLPRIIGQPGLRPRDWPVDVLGALGQATPEERRNGIVALLLFSRHLDAADIGAARVALLDLMAAEPSSHRFRVAFLLHAARFAAWHERDPATARQILALVPDSPSVQPYLTFNTLAAVDCREGFWSAALASVAAARKAVAAADLRLSPDDIEALAEVEREARAGRDRQLAA